VHRIAQRLGLIGLKVGADEAHELLGGMIPDEDVYSLHVNLVTHGRRVCKARHPACDACVLLEFCRWGRKALASGGV
jgi:endonuclease-3